VASVVEIIIGFELNGESDNRYTNITTGECRAFFYEKHLFIEKKDLIW
jgi:hypothetical protein